MVVQNSETLNGYGPVDYYEEDIDKVVGCTPVILNQLHVKYLRECIAKIGHLKAPASIEANYDRFNHYLAIYSTEPRLLDSVLPEFVASLVKLIDLNRVENKRFSTQTEESFRYLKSLALICRYKVIASLLSHEVAFLEPLLSALEYYVYDIKDCKHVIYVLQIWLYIVCKNPFDLARLSKEHNLVGTGLDALSQRLTQVLMEVQLNYNKDTSFYRLTPNLLAQILTRNKDNSAVLGPQIKQSIEVLRTNVDSTLLRAHLSLLSSILKFGKRQELLTYADEIYSNIKLSIFETSACYFAAKVYQRLALVFLPPKLANWRYKRGYRSLEANLAVRRDGVKEQKEDNSIVDQAGDTLLELSSVEKVPQMLEIFLLLLRNETDDVRTSSAKALGRICARLPKQQTDFVIQQILKHTFTEFESASSWHGGCLALAELSGRGCLLPEHLMDVVPIICDALLYDRQCNGNVTESNVRDASSYICWAFARAYGMDVLGKHADLLAQRLVCTALFDREVNVRRAASASFQENVGRHGGFAHGIQVLVITDFIGVGKIRYCYENACVQVAQYAEYRRSILDHLCQLKCVYWDEKIRLLSAVAIERLVPLESEYAIEKLLPTFCDNLKTCVEFASMQGYLMAIAAVVRGLNSNFNETFKNSNQLQAVYEFIVQNLADFSQFSLKGFSYLIKSSCIFVETVLNADLQLNLNMLTRFITILEHILQKSDEAIRKCSTNALSSLFNYCYRHNHLNLLREHMQKYLDKVVNTNSEDAQIACILSLNCLPQSLFKLVDDGKTRLTGLFNCYSSVILSPTNEKWYNARIYALRSLVHLIQVPNMSILVNCETIFECVSKCINDKTKTDHGDVGRYVREAALINLKPILTACSSIDDQFEKHLDNSVAFVLKRCSDTVDKTRATAIKTMLELVECDFPIKEVDRLRIIFSRVDVNILNGVSFLPLEKLLDLKPYRCSLLRGLIPSMGSILAWTAKHTQDILSKHLKPIKRNKKEMEAFAIELLEIGKEFELNDDEAQLFFNALQRMVSDGLFAVFEDDPDSSEEFVQLCEFVRAASSKKAKQRLRHALIRTLGSFLVLNFDSQTAQKFRQKLASFLASPYNSLRSMSAEQLVEALNLANEQVYNRPNIQQAVSLLNDTDWNQQTQVEELKEIASKVKDLLN